MKHFVAVVAFLFVHCHSGCGNIRNFFFCWRNEHLAISHTLQIQCSMHARTHHASWYAPFFVHSSKLYCVQHCNWNVPPFSLLLVTLAIDHWIESGSFFSELFSHFTKVHGIRNVGSHHKNILHKSSTGSGGQSTRKNDQTKCQWVKQKKLYTP